VALTVEILEAARVPVTSDDVARRLGVPAKYVEAELAKLERRGYVRREACAPGACARCSLRSTCEGAITDRWVVLLPRKA